MSRVGQKSQEQKKHKSSIEAKLSDVNKLTTKLGIISNPIYTSLQKTSNPKNKPPKARLAADHDDSKEDVDEDL